MEDFASDFFRELIRGFIPKIGAFIRWIFLRKKYSYEQVLDQNWNNRIGFLAISIIVIAIIISLNL